MAKKKQTKKTQPKKESKAAPPKALSPEEAAMAKLPKEAQEKLKDIKQKLDKFKKSVVDKFDKYISGIALLPPPKPVEGKEVDKDKINDTSSMEDISAWDSLKHMEIIAALEDNYEIEPFTGEEIVQMTVVSKIKEILEAKLKGT